MHSHCVSLIYLCLVFYIASKLVMYVGAGMFESNLYYYCDGALVFTAPC
jgi:hypothetical protein